MRPLHIRLLAAHSDAEAIDALARPLRAAGHVVATSSDQVVPDGVASTPDFVVVAGDGAGAPDSLDAAEARHIAAALRFVGGNRRQAALLLGIARSTLLAKIRRYRL